MSDAPTPANTDTGLELSVVVPVYNEAENIEPLVREIAAALGDNRSYEIIYVDDGSSDRSGAVLERLAQEFPAIRYFRHRRRCGQTAAVVTGVRQARGQIVATLDGDGQNDPADIANLRTAYGEPEAGTPLLIAGHRQGRRDSWVKRVSSRIANAYRRRALGDDTPDTGCGLKLFRRDDFLALPAFDHMHRFLPALFIRAGGTVVSVPVSHRPRERGRSKYGVLDRLWVGIADVRGVAWLARRPVNPALTAPSDGQD